VAASLVAEDDVVAGANRADGRSDRFHDAGPFVAEHGRQRHGVLLVADVQIGLADAGGRDPHQDLVGTRGLELEFAELERRGLLVDYGGGDLHPPSFQLARCATNDRHGLKRVVRARSAERNRTAHRSWRSLHNDR
jgi:hypothetical protein